MRQDEDFVYLYLRKQNLKPAAPFSYHLKAKRKNGMEEPSAGLTVQFRIVQYTSQQLSVGFRGDDFRDFLLVELL